MPGYPSGMSTQPSIAKVRILSTQEY